MGRTFNLDFKLNAINYAEINGVRKAAQEFNVDPKSIREWRFLKIPSSQLQNGRETAHHSFNLDFKLNAIKYAKENGVEAAAKEYNINPEGIREWCSGRYLKGALKRVPLSKNEITKKHRKKNLINVDKKCLTEEIENRLVLWIIEQQKNNVLVTKPMIKVKALELFKTEHSESQKTFKATLTWVQRFLARKKLNLSCNNVFTSDFKLNVINYAEKNGILTAAKEYNVSSKYVREWYNRHNLNDASKQTNLTSLNRKLCPRRRVQRAFTLDFKLNAVKYAKENGLSAAAKEYNVDRKSISEWCSGRKLKSGLKQMTQNKSTGKKDIKKCTIVNKEYEEMENLLALWIVKQQKNNMLVTKEMIKVKALELLNREHKENFNASFTWMQGFFKRKNLNWKSNVSTNVRKITSKSNVTVESSPSIVTMEQKSEEIDKPMLQTTDFKLVRNNLHKIVNASKRKLYTEDVEFKKRKLVNCVTSYYYHSNCTSNVVNENQISIKTKETSLNSQSNPADDSFTKTEQQFKNASSTVKEGESNFNQTVHPLTVQGLIACIAFQTFFNVKHI